MRITRRSFLSQSAAAAAVMLAAPACNAGGAAAALSGSLLINHVGFARDAAKFCLLAGAAAASLDVVDAASGRVLHTARLEPVTGDLGQYLACDLSIIIEAGRYELRCGTSTPVTLIVADDLYVPPIRASVAYFATQRCGNSTSGFNAPCHLDDGIRNDNQKRQDATGGWHDACDLRRWVDATLYGMTGLARVLERLGQEQLDAKRVIDEMRWGNRYFLKMQEPAGYLMHHCGGDKGNAFTDNVIGTGDDRVIDTQQAELPAQFHFVSAQAALARHVGARDPEYARICEEAARSAFNWCRRQRTTRALSLATGAVAAAQMHRSFGGERFGESAAHYLEQMLKLQVDPAAGDEAEASGFFLARADDTEPYREIMDGNMPMLALCEVLESFPDHSRAGAWRGALRRHVDHLSAMSRRSAFGTIPFGFYTGNDPGGGRKLASRWYRWFMKRHGDGGSDDWWVGINAHLASNGVGLARASRILDDANLLRLAQRQLDWILGVNPFNASTVSGVGRGQPPLFVTGEYKPATPSIPGGVMNGIGGTDADEPALEPGSYHTCEYWTPMVCYTMWLMAELHARHARR